jgi:drug/metabolite transporter (DMT)-like permease|tara:strand:- start:32 stop:919 length:888 start_codon:yes stop_codon:yes gene_type:complete
MAIKLISGNYALHQIILIRSILAILFTLLVFVPIDGGFKYLLTKRLGLHLLRGFGIVIANLCFFTALVTVPLGEAVAIFFVAPLMITALSVFIIREEVGLSSWIAVLVGLLGVLIILRPGFEEFNPGYILPLVAALAYALVQIITGKMGENEKASSMAFYIQLIFIVVCSLFGLFFGDGHLADPSQPIINYLFRPWTIPSWVDGMIMIGVGLLSGVGAYFISQAYRISKGSVVAPFEYVALPLAIFWSITLFGDWPDMASWMGIVLIAGAGIFNVFSEKIQARTIVFNRPMPRNR